MTRFLSLPARAARRSRLSIAVLAPVALGASLTLLPHAVGAQSAAGSPASVTFARVPATAGRLVTVHAQRGRDSMIVVALDTVAAGEPGAGPPSPTRSPTPIMASRTVLFHLAPSTARDWAARLAKVVSAQGVEGTLSLAESHPFTTGTALHVARATPDGPVSVLVELATGEGPALTWRADDVRAFARGLRQGATLVAPEPGDEPLANPAAVYLEFQVEKPVVAAKGGCSPGYPRGLREAGTAGEVILQYVVGADGIVEPASVKVLRTTHGDFTRAVREALPCMRFLPAELHSRRVRQLVQQPFTFDVVR